MRIGMMFDTEKPFDDVVGQVASLHDAGIETAWASQIFAYDALTTLAAVGREVPGIGFGTAVVPTYPRHPVMLAAQALTVQAATGGRLTLGIGLSHQLVIENVFGQSFEKPARHMREYLSILMPLLEGEQATFQGETLSASTFGPFRSPPLRRRCSSPPWAPHARHRRPHGLGHGDLDDRSGHHRIPRGPDHQGSRRRGRTTRAADRRRAPGLRDRRRGRRPGEGGRGLLHLRHACRRTGPCSTVRVRPARPTSPSSGTESEVKAQVRRLADIGTTDFCGAPFGTAEEIRAPSGRWPRLVGA